MLDVLNSKLFLDLRLKRFTCEELYNYNYIVRTYKFMLNKQSYILFSKCLMSTVYMYIL